MPPKSKEGIPWGSTDPNRPVGPGTKPYHVVGTFPGAFLPKIVVQCANRTKVVEVGQIPAGQAGEHLRKRAGLASSHS
ncbi:MAG: hypothetical protein ACRDJO_04825 [Actinomycetota bacterium]